MSFFSTCNIDVVSLENVTKIALYSDGLNESEQDDKSPFGKSIEADFANSMLLRPFLREFYSKVRTLEDDLTLIFIAKEANKKTLFAKEIEITSKLSQIGVANAEVEKFMEDASVSDKEAGEAVLIFNELLMNAFEHGSLGISSSDKDRLIEDDKYDAFLEELESKTDSKTIKIKMELEEIKGKNTVIKISIADAGGGFEFSETLKTIYLDKDAKFSGRGVWMAKDLTDGVYFNERGNKTTFFKTVSLKK
jgi:two-component system, HptB-dependent secretion and biofilm response regulator